MLTIIWLAISFFSDVHSAGILFPRASESRQVISLDGLWNFDLDNSTDSSDLKLMPVPSSYNDVGTDLNLRDHAGVVWYQRTFYVPKSWSDQKVWIRFSSVNYAAEVTINGELAVSHEIGHLPFQAEISSLLNFGTENTITVAVDNTLSTTTVPQGKTSKLASGRLKQTYTFDFFNYAGIDRPVVLYTTPATYIDDISVLTDIDGTTGLVNYSVTVEGSDKVTAKVTLLDKTGEEVASDTDLEGTLSVPKANFWWPYLMDPNPGYLYSLQIELFDKSDNLVDTYTLPVGIRTITWDTKTVNINNKPIYLRGFGRHEDSDIRGKGLDLPLIVRDFNLIKWVGANSFRTSNYPYAEEIMDLADQLGIMVINESPATNTVNLSDKLLETHKKSLTEMIQRDKNHPSVIMWSAANKPSSGDEAAEDYYKEIVAHIKSFDTTRPVTVATDLAANKEYSGQFLDVASVNVYYGWLHQTGFTDVIFSQVTYIARKWNEVNHIPVMITSYGAETQEGYHDLPAFTWSEEFQEQYLSEHFRAFDQLRSNGYFVGEMIWNFADFNTYQQTIKAGGNKEGIFTRNRQPKASAHLLRKRYWALAKSLDNADLPDDYESYVFGNGTVNEKL